MHLQTGAQARAYTQDMVPSRQSRSSWVHAVWCGKPRARTTDMGEAQILSFPLKGKLGKLS